MSTSYGPAGSLINVSHDELMASIAVQSQQNYINQPLPVTKQSVADEIDRTVNGPRQNAYGGPEDNHRRIANHWTAFFQNKGHKDVTVTPADVCALMILLKVARIEYMPEHHDSWVDAGGYAVCGAVCAANP